jgi:hypothetical protein
MLIFVVLVVVLCFRTLFFELSNGFLPTLLESAANLVLVPAVNLSAVLQHLECFARADAVLAHCSEIELVIPRYELLFFYPWEA